MVPKTLIQLSDSFHTLDITESGFFKNVDASIFSKNYISSSAIEIMTNHVSIDPILGVFTLEPIVEFLDDFSSPDFLDITSAGECVVIERQDGKDKWIYYPYSEATQYPISIQVPKYSFCTDQGFGIQVQKAEIGEYADLTGYMLIFVSGITPAVETQVWGANGETIQADTLVISLPLYSNEPIKYGFTNWEPVGDGELGYRNIEDICYSVYDLGVSEAGIQNWLNSGTPNMLTFKRLDNYLYFSADTFSIKHPITTSENFSIVDPVIKVIFTGPCSPLIRFASIKYETAGDIKFKIPIGYSATQQGNITAEIFKTISSGACSVSTSRAEILGEYFFGQVNFSSDSEYSTPVVYRFGISVPPVYTNNTRPSMTDITEDVIGWTVNRRIGAVPTANITIDNGNFKYTYLDFNNWIGKHIRVWGGYEETNITPRFTGIVTEVSIDRSSPSKTTASLKCSGLSYKLDKPSLFSREYDGDYHQDSIVDLCRAAEISSIITETPVDNNDKLFYGKDKPKYSLVIGHTFRSMVNTIVEFSGYIVDEDEWGNVIYANKLWRDTGFDNPIAYGDADLGNVATNQFRLYNTISDISSLSISTSKDNIRNVIQVIGQADRDIDASPNGLYPAYKMGDPIRVSLENQQLISKMGHKICLVVVKPELCTPEQCLIVAQHILRLTSEAQKTGTLTILGDNKLHPGMTIGIQDTYLLDSDMFIISETVNETFANGAYTATISGPMLESVPEEY